MDYNASLGGEYRLGSRALVGARVRFGGPFTPSARSACRHSRTRCSTSVPSFRSVTGGRSSTSPCNVTSTKYPEIRSSGFINPGAPVVVRVAVSFDTP